ncbi:MAG: ATP-binding cassette domain-containing protein [Lentisphaerae bacterium]|nr:ATP-binding cassette domain-containing protein [Lentisphaerota bacterium]
MALISVKQAVLGFGGHPILDGVELHIERGDRMCLLGANGAGKSSLLRVLGGEMPLDGGEVAQQAGIRIASMPQQIPSGLAGSVLDIVHPDHAHDTEGTLTLESEQLINRLGLDADASFETLSGGTRRRVLLARALLGSPDLVMLDEPTNHLDIESILWLESFLIKMCKTILFVTHDRAFLRRLATRIVELDRGRIIDWACDYDTFLARKEAVLAAEDKEWDRLDKKLEKEEAWLRRGVKARTTRNQGRVRALGELRAERGQRRERTGAVNLSIQEASRTGRLVVRAQDITFGYAGKPLIRRCSTDVLRGDKIGVIGSNGCGKTTLLRILLEGELEGGLRPDSGTVRLGTNVQVAYSDQLRGTLDDNQTVLTALAPDQEYVTVDGVRRHVLGYLADFLFTPDRARQPVRALSGGERNRLLLARLFAQPSNVLVLDEPTNDLDLDTLDLLEERVAGYGGTVLMVSHDRAFLNAVVDRTLVFEKFDNTESGGPWLGRDDGWFVNEYAGGYDDWVAKRRPPPAPATAKPARPARGEPARKRRLTFAERTELDALPTRIETLESEQKALHVQLADPVFYRSGDAQGFARAQTRSQELDASIETAYKRWAALDLIRRESE